jgi:hypothetical protein
VIKNINGNTSYWICCPFKKTEKTTYHHREFFLFLGCICYTKLVCIIPLSGTQPKKEPLSDKGSKTATFTAICSFLYILNLKGFYQKIRVNGMHKKRMFYTYAVTSLK